MRQIGWQRRVYHRTCSEGEHKVLAGQRFQLAGVWPANEYQWPVSGRRILLNLFIGLLKINGIRV